MYALRIFDSKLRNEPPSPGHFRNSFNTSLFMTLLFGVPALPPQEELIWGPCLLRGWRYWRRCRTLEIRNWLELSTSGAQAHRKSQQRPISQSGEKRGSRRGASPLLLG